MDEIMKNSENNLKAGFSATGIYILYCLYDPSKVLNKLPSWTEITDQDNRSVWSDSFSDLLKSARYDTQGISTPKRKEVLTAYTEKSLTDQEIDLGND